MKYNIKSMKHFGKWFILLSTVVNLIPDMCVTPVLADEISVEEHMIYTDTFDISEEGVFRINDGDYIIEIEVEDVVEETVLPNYSQTWSYGTYDKKLTATLSEVNGFSVLGSMSARFKGSVTSSLATITSISEGDMNAALMTAIGNPIYEITTPSAGPNDYAAVGRYRQKYTLSFIGGQHDMCLYLYINTNAQAQIFLYGIW